MGLGRLGMAAWRGCVDRPLGLGTVINSVLSGGGTFTGRCYEEVLASCASAHSPCNWDHALEDTGPSPIPQSLRRCNPCAALPGNCSLRHTTGNAQAQANLTQWECQLTYARAGPPETCADAQDPRPTVPKEGLQWGTGFLQTGHITRCREPWSAQVRRTGHPTGQPAREGPVASATREGAWWQPTVMARKATPSVGSQAFHLGRRSSV